MNRKISLALLATFAVAVPASAQISTTDRVRDRVILGGDRAGSRTDTRTGGTIGDVIFGRPSDQRTSSKVPKGHLPPRGMCRVWIDGVPPGRQPEVTTCAQAERDRVQYGANARVIYGDRESFPGKGKGKFKNREQRDCQRRDAVVIGGRVVDVCTDGAVRQDRRDRRDRRDRDDDDRWDDDDDSDRRKSAKAQKSGKSQNRGKGRKG